MIHSSSAQELLGNSAQSLDYQYGTSEASAIFRELVASIRDIPYGQVPLVLPNLIWTEAQKSSLLETVAAILAGQPLQYALGEAWFYDYRFVVSPAVLIPRGETEELVQEACRLAGTMPDTLGILDVGTGSGCIAITVAALLTQAGRKIEVQAWDISLDALAIAKQNAANIGVPVHFEQRDALNYQPPVTQKWQMILSNPPYIPASEAADIAAHVKDYEPHLALFVPDNQPLCFYESLADLALNHLESGGYLGLECHFSYAQTVANYLSDKGLIHVRLLHDIHNKARMVFAQKK
jgi:release factor glutamine methyltransferase